MLTRFELHVILRNQVADRGAVSRALLVEAIMEELAAVAGADPVGWGLAGLGADLDVELAAANPDRRGEMAADMLRDEGAPEEVVNAVRAFRIRPIESLAQLPAALVVADAMAAIIWDELGAGTSIDDLDGTLVAVKLSRAERRGGEAAARVAACVQRLGVPIDRGAEASVAALRRVRADLRAPGDRP